MLKPDGGNRHRLVAGVREHLRARRGRRHVGAHDVEPLRRHAEPDQAAVLHRGDAEAEVGWPGICHSASKWTTSKKSVADLDPLGHAGDGACTDRDRPAAPTYARELGASRRVDAAGGLTRLEGAEERSSAAARPSAARSRARANRARPVWVPVGARHVAGEGATWRSRRRRSRWRRARTSLRRPVRAVLHLGAPRRTLDGTDMRP